MTTLTEGAFAKINLTLDVLDRREDGYHDIRSILQTVALRDDIELLLDTGTGWHIECETAGIPLDETNLAWRAARVFFDTFGGEPDGLTIRITKRIPSGAGLGGGSADAAAVLRALNRWKDYPLSVYALCELGAQIGSDVPFCVLCGTALAEGRGERLTKLPDTPEMFTVICKPDVCFSTPALYAKLDDVALAKRPDTRAMRAALEKGDLEAIGAGLCNVFEQVAIPDHLELNYIKSIMMSYGAYGAQMTGSGSGRLWPVRFVRICRRRLHDAQGQLSAGLYRQNGIKFPKIRPFYRQLRNGRCFYENPKDPLLAAVACPADRQHLYGRYARAAAQAGAEDRAAACHCQFR